METNNKPIIIHKIAIKPEKLMYKPSMSGIPLCPMSAKSIPKEDAKRKRQLQKIYKL
jgi:hypothetical protein